MAIPESEQLWIGGDLMQGKAERTAMCQTKNRKANKMVKVGRPNP